MQGNLRERQKNMLNGHKFHLFLALSNKLNAVFPSAICAQSLGIDSFNYKKKKEAIYHIFFVPFISLVEEKSMNL